jgi:hypothetical protein
MQFFILQFMIWNIIAALELAVYRNADDNLVLIVSERQIVSSRWTMASCTILKSRQTDEANPNHEKNIYQII